MFDWLKKKESAPAASMNIRDTLFGDASLEQWTGNKAVGEPWDAFRNAKTSLDSGKKTEATESLRKIAMMPGLESRHYLQAWHFLRQLGVQPPAEVEKEVLGVVVEVGMDHGLDLLAGYAELKARYYNCNGGGTIWERPDGSLDSYIQNLLNEGRVVVAQIGPWDKQRPGPPPRGQVRLNILAPGGLFFGQGPLEVIAKDAIGGRLLSAATMLLQQITEKTRK